MATSAGSEATPPTRNAWAGAGRSTVRPGTDWAALLMSLVLVAACRAEPVVDVAHQVGIVVAGPG